MGRMKELITNKADEIALRDYGKDFYELTPAEQDKVWKQAEQEGNDYLANLADAERERRKYER